MSYKVREIRSLIYERFDSEADFARAIGWNRQQLNRITTAKKIPDLNEVNVIAQGLGESVETIAQIFLRHKSPNEQHSDIQVKEEQLQQQVS